MYDPLLTATAARALKYLDALATRPVRPDPIAVAQLSRWDIPLPEEPSSPENTIRELDEVGSPATMALSGPRFFGFVIGGALPVTVAAQWLATAWDQNTGLARVTPSTVEIERIALKWLLDVLHLPAECGGAFVTGATMANFTALAAARHVLLGKMGWDVEREGLFGAPAITVVVGEEVHPTVSKALGMLGLGRERVLRVPVDDQGRMRADALPRISGPTIVCLQAGNVNTGAIDPIREVIAYAKKHDAWVHVDGAFGLWAAAAPDLSGRVAGIEQADSWATDAHKWLNVPYDSGLAFVRNGQALQDTMSIHAAYLPGSVTRDSSNFTPELSRRARGVEVWAALRTLGRGGVAEMISRNSRQARRFAEGLRAAGCEILNEVVLNQVLVSFGSPARNERIIAAIQQDGTCWCGGTVWQGKSAMRISVCCWATTDRDVELSLDAITRLAKADQKD
ncbi:MAG: aminotransferase class V-fold PLP-dependent enzyme [Opitutus sp.]